MIISALYKKYHGPVINALKNVIQSRMGLGHLEVGGLHILKFIVPCLLESR